MAEQSVSEQQGDHAAAVEWAKQVAAGDSYFHKDSLSGNLARCYLELSSTAASTAAKVREMCAAWHDQQIANLLADDALNRNRPWPRSSQDYNQRHEWHNAAAKAIRGLK